MTETDVVQLFNLLFAVAMVPAWILAGMILPRVGWKAIIPVIIGLMAAPFYFLVLFTDLNELHKELFTLLSSMMRLYEFSSLFFGAVVMIKANPERVREFKARYFTKHGASHE